MLRVHVVHMQTHMVGSNKCLLLVPERSRKDRALQCMNWKLALVVRNLGAVEGILQVLTSAWNVFAKRQVSVVRP